MPVTQQGKPCPLFGKPLKAINVGLELFHESLKLQGLDVLQVDWKPPAAGNQLLAKMLDRLLN